MHDDNDDDNKNNTSVRRDNTNKQCASGTASIRSSSETHSMKNTLRSQYPPGSAMPKRICVNGSRGGGTGLDRAGYIPALIWILSILVVKSCAIWVLVSTRPTHPFPTSNRYRCHPLLPHRVKCKSASPHHIICVHLNNVLALGSNHFVAAWYPVLRPPPGREWVSVYVVVSYSPPFGGRRNNGHQFVCASVCVCVLW